MPLMPVPVVAVTECHCGTNSGPGTVTVTVTVTVAGRRQVRRLGVTVPAAAAASPPARWVWSPTGSPSRSPAGQESASDILIS